MKELLEKLKSCPLFDGIASEQLEAVLDEIDAVKMVIHKGEHIELSSGRTLGVVLEGYVQVVQNDYWGARSIIHMLMPGKMLGESFTCFAEADLHQETIAQTDGLLLVFSKDRLLGGRFAQQRQMLENLIKIYGIHQRVFLQKFQLLSKRKTRERLLCYLSMVAAQKQSSCFTVPFTRQEMADYLCVERSAMCTELSALQKEGVLRFKGRQFELIQPSEQGK